MKAAIMGYGPVGQATELLLLRAGIECEIQDPFFVDKMVENWVDIDLAFICVPSDLDEETQRLDLSFVNKAIQDVPEHVHCVIRSTIGPDQVNDLTRPSSVMPEFIREHHWREDVLSNKTPCVIGCNGDSVPEIEALAKKFQERFMNPIVTDPASAMMMKMTINMFLATKVAFANNVWALSKSLGISYIHLKQLLQLDERLGESHWDVPGPSGKFGFGGKCFPKDATHYASMFNSELMNEVLKYKI